VLASPREESPLWPFASRAWNLLPWICGSYTPADILKTQVSRAYYCEKKQKLPECFDDCCALFRESRGVAPQFAFCNEATAAALGRTRHGITIAVGTWPKPREIYLIADEAGQ
jgi:hypothetical protein